MNRCFVFIFLSSICLSCNGFFINGETSEIATFNSTCLDSLAWEKMLIEHSVDNIKDSSYLRGLEKVKTHFIKPEYILYFESPDEIIGCNSSSIRVVYNENISFQSMSGLSPYLSNVEQKRIRNRFLSELMKYQCEEGKLETLEATDAKVPFSESHTEYSSPFEK